MRDTSDVPVNLEAERAVLGALLLDSALWDSVADTLRASAFHRVVHQHIYRAMDAVVTRGDVLDFLTVRDELTRRNQLDEVGVGYLAELTDGVPHRLHLASYVRLVQESAQRRRVQAVGQRLIDLAAETTRDLPGVVDQAEQWLCDLALEQARGELKAASVLSADGLALLEALGQGHGTGVPTGFVDLDTVLLGLQPGSLNLLAARPAQGKTALALAVAIHAATHGVCVAFFSLEMAWSELWLRLVSMLAQIDGHALRAGRLTASHYPRIAQACEAIEASRLWLDDSPMLTVADVRSRTRRLKLQADLGLVVLDYLQLLTPAGKSESRVLELAVITRALKALAKDLQVPVLALAQLSRAVESRHPPRPQLSDLRESGSLEQDADVVLLLWRPEYYDHDERPGEAELLIAKHRNGQTGAVTLTWMAEQTRFTNHAR